MKKCKDCNFTYYRSLSKTRPAGPFILGPEGGIDINLQKYFKLCWKKQLSWKSNGNFQENRRKPTFWPIWALLRPKKGPKIWPTWTIFHAHLEVASICLLIKFHGLTLITFWENGPQSQFMWKAFFSLFFLGPLKLPENAHLRAYICKLQKNFLGRTPRPPYVTWRLESPPTHSTHAVLQHIASLYAVMSHKKIFSKKKKFINTNLWLETWLQL